VLLCLNYWNVIGLRLKTKDQKVSSVSWYFEVVSVSWYILNVSLPCSLDTHRLWTTNVYFRLLLHFQPSPHDTTIQQFYTLFQSKIRKKEFDILRKSSKRQFRSKYKEKLQIKKHTWRCIYRTAFCKRFLWQSACCWLNTNNTTAVINCKNTLTTTTKNCTP